MFKVTLLWAKNVAVGGSGGIVSLLNIMVI
jgi:hypothetical protein